MRLLRWGTLVVLCVLTAMGCSQSGCSKRKAAWPGPAANPAIEEARRLLKEAGYEFGNDFPELEILYNTNEAHKKIAAAVQEMWRKNLGIDAKLRNTEWKTYLEQMSAVDYQIIRRGWIGDYTDPNTFLGDLFTSTSGNNNMKWADPEFDRLCEEAHQTNDPRKRIEILQRAEARLMEEMPIIPVYFYATQTMWRANLHGMHENIMNIFPLKEVAHEDGSKLLVMNVGAEPQTLDPNVQRGVPEHRINLAIFEGLLTYTPKTLEPRAGVAESWTSSSDGLTWTFKLRDCKWTNGRAVTAHDFVYGWRRILDPALAADYAHIVFDYVKNAKAYYDGATADATLAGFATLADAKRAEAAAGLVHGAQARHVDALKRAAEGEKDAAIKANLEKAAAEAAKRRDVKVEDVGVRAVDDRTLVAELAHPCHYFLFLVCFPAYNPIPREAVEKHAEKWVRPENIVSNGPFRMKEWVTNSHILVERSPDYWDSGKVKQQQIKFLPIDNVSTAYTMFQAGQCDWIDTVPTEFAADLLKDPNFHSIPYLGTYFYSCNVTRKPVNDKRVRRALALAIDREAIVSQILRGRQKPAYSVVPPLFEPPVFLKYESQRFYAPSGPN